jgi:hypothetical protein
MNLEGGCSCGAIRYKLTNTPLIVHACHCRDCQRVTGSGFVINIWIEKRFVESSGAKPKSVLLKGGTGMDHEADYPVRTGVVQAAHLREQPFTLRRFHQAMVRGGTHQRHMLLGIEIGGPHVARDANLFEVAAALDIFAQVLHLLRRWRWPCAIPAVADRVVSFSGSR